MIGAKGWEKMNWRLCLSVVKLLGLSLLVLLGPFVLFPQKMLSFFFPSQFYGEELELLVRSLLWIWLYAFTNGISFLGVGLQTATRQTLFYMVICNLSWVTYLVAFYGMNSFCWSPDKLWLLMACDTLLAGAINISWAKKAAATSPIAKASTDLSGNAVQGE
jgi:Na+-driven multidrug efflux pump